MISTYVLGAVLCALGSVTSLIHHLSIHNDDRTVFKIETFGFVEGGKMKIDILDFSLHFTTKQLDDYKQVVSATPANHTLSSEITLLPNEHKNSTKHTQHPVTQPVARPVSTNATRPGPQPVSKPVSTNITKPVSKPVATNATRTNIRRHLQSVPHSSSHMATSTSPNPSGSNTNANSTHGKATSKAPVTAPVNLVGFVMRHATSESAAQSDLESIMEKRQCILEHLQPNDVFIDLSDQTNWKQKIELSHTVTEENVGLYSLIFARCYPAGRHYTSFKLDATFYNPGPDYLSAGDAPLPDMYFIFFGIFSAALIAWVWVLRRGPASGTVHRVHYMMLILLVLKCLSLFFEGVRYHYISIYGVSEMWSTVYYIFAFMKGIMLFTVILLIGSGWSLMKSYLNDQEKRIIWFVLVLQVLDNIAMIVLEESAPGSQGWLTWRDILHLVDIICCCAILMPIVWSIKHLRQAAEVDGKAQHSLAKLQLFRQFYVMVVVYVYFTRIVVYVLAATIPFYLLWLGPMATELATFIFFTVTGFKFRPAVDNPYLPVRSEDLEGAEYGLDDDEHGLGDVQILPAKSIGSGKGGK